MCTAVDGGSIHRAATRISAASDQRSTTPMPSHRTRDRRTKGRRKPLPTRVSGSVSGFSVTLQDNSAGWLAARSLWPILVHDRVHDFGAQPFYDACLPFLAFPPIAS